MAEPSWVQKVRAVRLGHSERQRFHTLSREAQLMYICGRALRGPGPITDKDIDNILWPQVQYLLAHPEVQVEPFDG